MSAILLASLLSACSTDPVSLSFADNIEGGLSIEAVAAYGDDLHQPYTVGARFSLYVASVEGEPAGGWTFTTEDDDIIAIGEQEAQLDEDEQPIGVLVHLRTLSAGDAELEVRSSEGELLGSVTLPVRTPDSVRLYGSGPMLTNQSDAEVGEAVIRTGNTGRFMLTLYEGDTELHGTYDMTVWAPHGASAGLDRDWNKERRQWLTVYSDEDGAFQVELYIGGNPIDALEVESLPKSELGDVTLVDGKIAGGDYAVLARTVDALGRDVQGVEYGWEVDGVPVDGRGDMLAYTYSGSHTQTLTAKLGNFHETITIHAEPGDTFGLFDQTGYVGSSVFGASTGGCAVAPAERLSPWLALLGLVGLVRRRRR